MSSLDNAIEKYESNIYAKGGRILDKEEWKNEENIPIYLENGLGQQSFLIEPFETPFSTQDIDVNQQALANNNLLSEYNKNNKEDSNTLMPKNIESANTRISYFLKAEQYKNDFYKSEDSTPVSILYKEVTGKIWPPKNDEYSEFYDGTASNNLKIKQLLVEEKYKNKVYKIDKNKSLIKDVDNIGELYQENIENPAGLDYSSPEYVPISNYTQESYDLKDAFTFTDRMSFDNVFKCSGESSCASAVTNTILNQKKGALIDKYGYRGDAWTFLTNAEKKGVPTINIYKDLKDSMSLSKKEVISYSKKAAKDPIFVKTIKNNLVPGNTVTLLYPTSSNFEKAKQESKGKTLSTHIGVVVDVDGELYIADDTGSRTHLRDIDDLIEGKNNEGIVITGMAMYNKVNDAKNKITADLSSFGINPTIKKTYRIAGVSTYRALNSLNKNAEVLKSEFNVSDEALAITQKLMPALMYRETASGYFKESESYNKSIQNNIIRNIAVAVSDKSESIGLTNVKLKDENNYFSNEDLRKLGLSENTNKLSREKKESPELTGILTPIAIQKRMNHLDSLLGDRKSEIPYDVYIGLLVQSWSQGMNNIAINIDRYKKYSDLNELSQYLNTSDNKKIKEFASYLGINDLYEK